MKTLIDYELDGFCDGPKREECRQIVFRAESLSEVLKYIEEIPNRLARENRQSAIEALTVAVPLIYRMGLDDSSSGMRLASELKDACCHILHPEFHAALCAEVEHIFRSFCRTTHSRAEQHLRQLVEDLARSGAKVFEPCRAYGRVKKPYSIFEKLVRYYRGQKSVKVVSIPSAGSLAETLSKFESNVNARMKGGAPRFGYSSEELPLVLPDLLAATVQFPSGFVKTGNLGVAKSRYERVFRTLVSEMNLEVIYGPGYSAKWHMNRLVFHAILRPNKRVRLPVEIFVRTDTDYFVGYANYWRYKGINLFGMAESASRKDIAQLVRKIKTCSDYREVQELIFNEIKSGQLSLF